MIEVPHMKWPFQMAGFNSSKVPFVEQDTPEEVAQCVAFVFSTEPGELVTSPNLGLTDPTFRQRGIKEAELTAVARQWEPRATLNFTRNELVGIAQTVGISVS